MRAIVRVRDTRIYAHAVRHGTASFELEPPDVAEMTRRYQALVERGYPYLVAQSAGEVLGNAYAAAYRAVRLTAGRWKIRSTLRRMSIAAASGAL
jgi:L-amino acid N-acyltransferase YncA